MSALAFDLSYEAPVVSVRLAAAPVARRDDGVSPAPRVGRHLYAVRGTVGEARRASTPTLDALLGGAISQLATGFAACPVCHEETMTARWTAGHGVAGGRCASCGTTLD